MLRSPTGQWWQYPLRSPSYRFVQINNEARRLDNRYHGLGSTVQASWQSAAERWFWWAQCIPWIYEYDPIKMEPATGVAAYRGVNLANLVNGLPVVDAAPLTATPKDDDRLDFAGSGVFGVVWTGRSVTPSGDFTAQVRISGMTHEPESGPALQRMTWGFAAPIVYDTLFDLTPLTVLRPGQCQMGHLAIAISVGDLGSAPFVGIRTGFQGPI